ncbi:hypothetical protein G6F23_014110 [Rhizopus arrhizus]|nr:hypothetical protein G6F23_014110 [Rhizopus arrhizus]
MLSAWPRLLVGGVFQLIDPNELYDTEDEDDGEDSVVLGEVVEGRDRVDAIDDDAVSDDVHTVTVHDDGIEVIVNFEDDEEDDSETDRA